MDEKGPQHKQLERGAVQDHREGGSAVIQHHDLMDHGQLQVGVGIVERDAAVFGQQHDEHPADQEQQRGAGVQPDRELMLISIGGEGIANRTGATG